MREKREERSEKQVVVWFEFCIGQHRLGNKRKLIYSLGTDPHDCTTHDPASGQPASLSSQPAAPATVSLCAPVVLLPAAARKIATQISLYFKNFFHLPLI